MTVAIFWVADKVAQFPLEIHVPGACRAASSWEKCSLLPQQPTERVGDRSSLSRPRASLVSEQRAAGRLQTAQQRRSVGGAKWRVSEDGGSVIHREIYLTELLEQQHKEHLVTYEVNLAKISSMLAQVI